MVCPFFLFLTEVFLGMAGFDMTAQLQTLGQAMGISLIAVAILSWRILILQVVQIASYGKLFAIIGLLWVLLLGFHGATGQASGPPLFGNLAINVVLAVLFLIIVKNNFN